MRLPGCVWTVPVVRSDHLCEEKSRRPLNAARQEAGGGVGSWIPDMQDGNFTTGHGWGRCQRNRTDAAWSGHAALPDSVAAMH